MRLKAESERDNLQKQLQGVKDLLLADGGKTINNETLERIRFPPSYRLLLSNSELSSLSSGVAVSVMVAVSR